MKKWRFIQPKEGNGYCDVINTENNDEICTCYSDTATYYAHLISLLPEMVNILDKVDRGTIVDSKKLKRLVREVNLLQLNKAKDHMDSEFDRLSKQLI